MPGDEIEIGSEGAGGTTAGKIGGRNNIVGNGNLILNLSPDELKQVIASQPSIKLMQGMDPEAKAQMGDRLDAVIDTSPSLESKIDALMQKSLWLKVKSEESTRSAEQLRLLSEAYQTLCQVMELDPLNTEAMRHAAVVLMELTPEDKSDETELLERARGILFSPKDDAQRFGLAQTTFLLAQSSNPTLKEPLEEARSMFQQLGQAEWVRKCEEELRKLNEHAAQAPAAGPSGPPAGWQPPPPTTPQLGFNPVGVWSVQVSDGSTLNATFQIGVPCQIQVNHPWMGKLSGWGDWVWMPPTNLRFQVLLNGYMPYGMSVFITGRQENSFVGYGEDSQSYTFTRVG